MGDSIMHEETGVTDRAVTHVDCRESLPADLPAGAYVVVDTMHFSTTVTELLWRGADHVHVPAERPGALAYRERHPEALAGGPKTEAYDPVESYDFINSPSDVQDVDVAGRPVSFTSSNGGATVTDLRERGGPGVDVYVGSTTNAAALARHLRTVDGPVVVVSAGTGGESATEDHLGAVLFDRYYREDPPDAAERRALREHLRVARGPGYASKNAVRNADVTEYEMALNSRPVVPHLVDGRLVDVAGERPVSEAVESVA